MDRMISCLALLFLIVAVGAGIAIFGYQIIQWLQTDAWHAVPLETVASGIRRFGADWLGLQRVYDWILALPLSILCIVAGFFVFWVLIRRRACDGTGAEAYGERLRRRGSCGASGLPATQGAGSDQVGIVGIAG